MISRIDTDQRFRRLDSDKLALKDEKTVGELLNGIHLHEVNHLVWPIFDSNHCLLWNGNVCSREFFLIDPKNPYQFSKRNKLLGKIIDCLARISYSYEREFKISISWKSKSPFSLSNVHKFPTQTVSNSNECGVLVCVYIWSFMKGMVIPEITADSFDR